MREMGRVVGCEEYIIRNRVTDRRGVDRDMSREEEVGLLDGGGVESDGGGGGSGGGDGRYGGDGLEEQKQRQSGRKRSAYARVLVAVTFVTMVLL